MEVTLVTHPERSVRSGITISRCSDDRNSDMQVLEGLLNELVYVAVRYTSHVGGIRVPTIFTIMKTISSTYVLLFKKLSGDEVSFDQDSRKGCG